MVKLLTLRLITEALIGILLVFTFVSNTYAWTDNFADGNLDGWEVVLCDDPEYQWATVQTTSNPYSRHMDIRNRGVCYLYIYSPTSCSPLTYISFQSKYLAYQTGDINYCYKYSHVYIQYIDDEGSVVGETSNIRDYLCGNSPDLVEISIQNNNAYLFVNGDLVNQTALSGDVFRFAFKVATCRWYVDDFSTEPYALLDMGEYQWDWNATEYDDNEIDVYWTVPLYFDESSDTYTIDVRRLVTGAIVNTTDITEEAVSYTHLTLPTKRIV